MIFHFYCKIRTTTYRLFKHVLKREEITEMSWLNMVNSHKGSDRSVWATCERH